MKTLKSDFLIHLNFLSMASMNIFCCYKKMFTLNKIKNHYLNMEDVTDTDYAHAKRNCRNFEVKN